jgi:tripartite ATP-independent transporter DctM subunit
MKLSDYKSVITETVATTSSIMLIIGAASAFAWFLTWERIPQAVTGYVLGIVDNKYIFLLIVNVFLLIVGMFIEGNAAMLVLVPIMLPIVKALGIDPIHFGLIFIFNMAIGTLTPPMGTVMFTICSVTGLKIKDFVRASWPFYFLLFLCLMIITYIPAVSLALPNLLSK